MEDPLGGTPLGALNRIVTAAGGRRRAPGNATVWAKRDRRGRRQTLKFASSRS